MNATGSVWVMSWTLFFRLSDHLLITKENETAKRKVIC
ncbi:hypothetical protein HMPREF1516_1943 [Streptococcus sp. CM6]|nr:hypothetical protein HMPREF1516_1943 [Streptococcus sp. CM6]